MTAVHLPRRFRHLGLLLVALTVRTVLTTAQAEPVADPFAATPPSAPAERQSSAPPPIPPPDGDITMRVRLDRERQTIEGFGASDAWHSDIVGRSWPEADKREVARLLFSCENDANGRPRGIGLSIWRFNIGAGSAEQGDASGIAAMGHGPGPTRVEGFLNADGSYDWSKQAGQRWFLQAAKSFGVDHFVAFSNSPPVHFTRNGRANSDGEARANLREDKFPDFAHFLGEVVEHFRDQEGIHFRYLSPINEPQWKWNGGQQEGSPYTNAEIARVARLVDAELQRRKLATKMEIPEAGDLRFGYEGGKNQASRQVQAFFDPKSPDYVADLPTLHKVFAAHSYFSDGLPDEFIGVRRKLRAELDRHGVGFSMTEYCLLRSGLDKSTRNRPIPPIDSALQMARIIHSDLTVADALTWQFWTAMDTQKNPDVGIRYYLIERALDRVHYRPNKLLWALGHYSRFVRPGYRRLEVERTDGLDSLVAADRELVSAYRSPDRRELVVVAINWRPHVVPLRLALVGKDAEPVGASGIRAYVTTEDPAVNLAPQSVSAEGPWLLQPRSLTTFVVPNP